MGKKRGSSFVLVLEMKKFSFAAQRSGNHSKTETMEKGHAKEASPQHTARKMKKQPSDYEKTFANHMSSKIFIDSNIYALCTFNVQYIVEICI